MNIGFLSGIIRQNWNGTEKISMAPAQGWHAQFEKYNHFFVALHGYLPSYFRAARNIGHIHRIDAFVVVLGLGTGGRLCDAHVAVSFTSFFPGLNVACVLLATDVNGHMV